MKILIIILATATLFNGDNKTIENTVKNYRSVENTINTNITSIDFTKSEIIGESHYGFRYNFDIRINNSIYLDILDFCRTNFPSILNGRVTEQIVIDEILSNLDNDNNIRIDGSPKGLRLLGAATEFFDAIEVEIILEGDNLLKLDLKFYSPL